MAEDGDRPLLYDVLDAWDLLDPDLRTQRYSMREWKQISRALAAASPGAPRPALGSVHLGVFAGLAVAEGRMPLGEIATHAVTAEAVWLPNPIASFLCEELAEGWSLLPESGSRALGSSPTTAWKPFWKVPADRRRAHLAESLPPILSRLRELRPLVECDAVRFISWECPMVDSPDEFSAHAIALAADPDFRKLTQQLPQHEYTLGARLGAIGMQATEDFSDGNVKKGDLLHLRDKSSIAVAVLLNAAMSTRAAASFCGQLAGDRLVYQYLVTGGKMPSNPLPGSAPIRLPNFSEAVLADLVAVRRDSELLGTLRGVLTDVAGTTEEQALPALKDRLDVVVARLNEDLELKKLFGPATIEIALAVVATALVAYTGGTSPATVGLGGAGALVAYLAKMLRPLLSHERREMHARAEVVRSIRQRLD